jgi:putative transcriptional regulator
MAKNRLRQIRHELMIDKQNEMADLLGINQSQYNRYERHKAEPTLDAALRIAKKLGKNVEDIFYIDDESPIG